jgi:hypothetical protein
MCTPVVAVIVSVVVVVYSMGVAALTCVANLISGPQLRDSLSLFSPPFLAIEGPCVFLGLTGGMVMLPLSWRRRESSLGCSAPCAFGAVPLPKLWCKPCGRSYPRAIHFFRCICGWGGSRAWYARWHVACCHVGSFAGNAQSLRAVRQLEVRAAGGGCAFSAYSYATTACAGG